MKKIEVTEQEYKRVTMQYAGCLFYRKEDGRYFVNVMEKIKGEINPIIK
jgi:hypothetical protein